MLNRIHTNIICRDQTHYPPRSLKTVSGWFLELLHVQGISRIHDNMHKNSQCCSNYPKATLSLMSTPAEITVGINLTIFQNTTVWNVDPLPLVRHDYTEQDQRG